MLSRSRGYQVYSVLHFVSSGTGQQEKILNDNREEFYDVVGCQRTSAGVRGVGNDEDAELFKQAF